MTFAQQIFVTQWNAVNTGNRRKWGKMMNQKQIWIDLLYAASYELENCIAGLSGASIVGTEKTMEQIECTGRHLLNLALEMKQELKKQ